MLGGGRCLLLFLSYLRNEIRNILAIKKMAKITKEYVNARKEGIAWLKSTKRDFGKGLEILSSSGYKPVVVRKLTKCGNTPFARQKLEYEIRQMIKVWYNPLDPIFEDVDLSDDAEHGNDGNPETLSDGDAQKIIEDADEENNKEDDENKYPPVIAKILYDFSSCYKQRSILHQNLMETGESNTSEAMRVRKDLIEQIDALSTRMGNLAKHKKAWEEQGILPTDAELDSLFGQKDDADGENSLEGLSVDELKKMKANAKTRLCRANNLLMYSTEIKPKDGKLNPMPQCPRRIKIERKIERETELVNKIDYKIALMDDY